VGSHRSGLVCDVVKDISQTKGEEAMAGYDINVGRDLLPGLLSGQNGLAKLVEAVLNQ